MSEELRNSRSRVCMRNFLLRMVTSGDPWKPAAAKHLAQVYVVPRSASFIPHGLPARRLLLSVKRKVVYRENIPAIIHVDRASKG